MATIITELKPHISDVELFHKNHIYKNAHIQLTIALKTTFMLEYQKDLLQELRWDIQDILDDTQQTSSQIQKKLEHILHNFNTQLTIFAEKSKYTEYIDLRWVVQIRSDDYYIASLIWSASLMIYRKQKMIHHIINQTSTHQKVSLFSELVDGKISNGDMIIVVGGDISIAMDEEDLNYIWKSLNADYSFDQMMQDHVASRVDLQDFVFSQQNSLTGVATKGFLNTYQDLTQWNGTIARISHRIISNKFLTLVWWLALLLWYLVWSVASLFFKQNPELLLSQDGETMPTIWEIRQDINQFTNIDPSSDTKSTLYANIVKKLTTLEQAKKWPNDVNELKKLVNQQFYKEFNIATLTDNEIKDSYIYNFDTTDVALANPLKLLHHKTLAVVGSQGLRFGIIDNTYRGNMVNMLTPLVGCSLNILKNGYYCFDQMNTVTMINKWAQETVQTKGGSFPTMIQDIATYGNTNMYILTKDPTLNAKGVYVLKYNNTLGSQKDFLEAKEYSFTNSGTNTFTSWFLQFAIDSTFLMWSPDQKKLYQFRRDKNADLVNSRVVKLVWWNQEYKPLSTHVKVIASSNSNYVYLFDKTQQTINVYSANPSKTNENNTSSFNLQYMFRFDISSAETVIDALITQDDKPMLYMLNKKWIIAIKLYEFFEQYKHTNTPSTVAPSSGTLLQ